MNKTTLTQSRPVFGEIPLSQNKTLRGVLSHALLIAVSLFFVVPFLWMLSTSFKSDQDVFRTPPSWLPHDNVRVTVDGQELPVYAVTFDDGVRELALVEIAEGQGTFVNPDDPSEVIVRRMRYAEPLLSPQLRWQNFPDALNRATRPGMGVNFWTYFKNSLIIAFFSVLGTLLSCAPVAYGFARIKWPGRDVVFVLVLGTIMLPFQVRMIPLYIFFTSTLGWGNTFLPLIVPAFFGNAYDIFLLRQFFRTIPEDLSDAARVDGASELQIFLRVIMPLSTPVLATVSVLGFLYAWNDFTAPLLFLTSPQNYTMAIGLQDFQGQHIVTWNQLMAASVVFTIPIIIAFFFAQRTFIQGIKLTGLVE